MNTVKDNTVSSRIKKYIACKKVRQRFCFSSGLSSYFSFYRVHPWFLHLYGLIMIIDSILPVLPSARKE